jgi:hypothetical protein
VVAMVPKVTLGAAVRKWNANALLVCEIMNTIRNRLAQAPVMQLGLVSQPSDWKRSVRSRRRETILRRRNAGTHSTF